MGVPHARILVSHGLCLEEYPDFLRERPRRCILPGGRAAWAFYIPCAQAEVDIPLPDTCCQLSGDNIGGLIVAAWEKPL